MEPFKKNDVSNTAISKRHFAVINSRIQNKYEEMKKRLDKSKSLDSLNVLNDSFVFVQAHKANITNQEKNLLDEDEKPETHNAAVEEIPVNTTLLHDVNETIDMLYSETYDETETEKTLEKFFDGQFEYNLTTSNSLESISTLNTESPEWEEPLPPPSPVPKTSIRDRIGSKIAAVKEKRRDKKKEKETRDKVEKLVLSNTTKCESPKILKKMKVGTVTIALIEATGLETDTTDEKPRMLCCRIRLGSEKYKSKYIKSHTPPFKWQELFNINLFEENMLEISLWDKDIFLGRCEIDLSKTKREKTHKMRLDLKGCPPNSQLFILLTISGVNTENFALTMADYKTQTTQIEPKHAWYHVREDYADVGYMAVFVYGAKGLSANDCYCVVALDNDRLQTPTEIKTNCPNWMKIFTFTVTDITSILEVTVIEEKKSEVVGKISIPLLRINNGKKKWYALKDSTQRERAKGSNPRILLEMKVGWNLARASIRVINPKEEKYLNPPDKLDRHIFGRNLSRCKAVGSWILDAFKVIKTCFEWESRTWNVIALVVWLVTCWFFRVWMLPLLFLLPFVWYHPENYFLIHWKRFGMNDTKYYASNRRRT